MKRFHFLGYVFKNKKCYVAYYDIPQDVVKVVTGEQWVMIEGCIVPEHLIPAIQEAWEERIWE